MVCLQANAPLATGWPCSTRSSGTAASRPSCRGLRLPWRTSPTGKLSSLLGLNIFSSLRLWDTDEDLAQPSGPLFRLYSDKSSKPDGWCISLVEAKHFIEKADTVSRSLFFSTKARSPPPPDFFLSQLQCQYLHDTVFPTFSLFIVPFYFFFVFFGLPLFKTFSPVFFSSHLSYYYIFSVLSYYSGPFCWTRFGSGLNSSKKSSLSLLWTLRYSLDYIKL